MLTFDTERAEAEHLADLLRRAHLEDDVPWSDMAVLVRSGRSSIPALRRSLVGAGVPVEVASDDTPLVDEPAVRPLLEALRAVVNLDNDDPDHPDFLDPDRAHGLLVSPLAGLDATDVRALSRTLRAREKDHAAATGRSPRPSPELLRDVLVEPTLLAGADGAVAARVVGLARLLRGARARLDEGATAEEVLWELWAGTTWPARLRGVRRVRRPRRPARPPRPRRGLRPVRDGGPHRGPARPHVGRQLPRHARRAADPRRHARRPRASAATRSGC